MSPYEIMRSTYHYTPHQKDATFYKDNKEQRRQYLLLNAVCVLFVFKNFY
jgi:hypothetical protein